MEEEGWGWAGPASSSSSRGTTVKFKMPTAVNLFPIRLDIEIDGQRYKDAITWDPADPDSEAMQFAKRTVKDLKLPAAFITKIASSIQNQIFEFRSYEGQEMHTGEKLFTIKLDLRVNKTVIKDQFLWDFNNSDADPEQFAITFCSDMAIKDPEAPVAIAFAIREQLYEAAVQSVVSSRESRIHKKRRTSDNVTSSKSTAPADVIKLFQYSVVRKRKEWEPAVEFLAGDDK